MEGTHINEITDEFLASIESTWREQLKKSYPMFRDVPISWKMQNAHPSLWIITTEKMTIEIQILSNKGKLKKAINHLVQKLDLTSDQILTDLFLFILYYALFSFIEAPFSIIGNFNDQEMIYKAIWDGITAKEPELSQMVFFKKLETLDPIIKEFIIINRLFLENAEFKWFNDKILLAPVILRNRKSPSDLNYLVILDFMSTCLYGTKKLIIDYYLHNKGNYYEKGKKILQLLLPNYELIELPNIENLYFKDTMLYENTLSNYQKAIRKIFEGNERYEGIQILATSLCDYIDFFNYKSLFLSVYSENNLIQNLFNQFSARKQSDFIKNILDNEKLFKNQDNEYDIFKIRMKHEFYKRNHPEINISGIDEYDSQSLESGNLRLKLVKTDYLDSNELEKVNFSYIEKFQTQFGLPVLIPLEESNFLLNEYNFKYKRLYNRKYQRLLGTYDLPDILEIYLDTTGSMFLQNDSTYEGFNDGSRRDICLAVLYGFLDAAKKASLREDKDILVRFHSFSEIQVSTPLVSLDKFFEGNNDLLRAIYSPNNGYEYENLNLHMYADDLKRLYIIITDGDLVIEGRTEREAKKIEKLLTNPLNQVILFEMRRQYSLGYAVQHIPNIKYYTIKSKEEMFQKGIQILLSTKRPF